MLSYVATSSDMFMCKESHVDLKIQEIRSKDDKIFEKENIIKEKSDTIASLRSEIASVQVRHSSIWNVLFVFLVDIQYVSYFKQVSIVC